MLYKDSINDAAVVVLQNKMTAAADCIQYLISEGYIPNKQKTTVLVWSNLLIQAYNNIDILSDEQQVSLNMLYRKITNM